MEKDLTTAGAAALAVPADLTDPAAVQPVVDRVSKELGEIEILVNNVGGGTAFGVGFDQLTDDDWRRVLDLNLLSAVGVTRAVLPGMRRLRRGSIVMVATVAAVQPGGFWCARHDPISRPVAR